MDLSKYKWVNPVNHSEDVEGHAFVHRRIWMVTNDFGEVLIYDTYSPVGNRNQLIANRLVDKYKELGAKKATLVRLLILPDSPSRYQ